MNYLNNISNWSMMNLQDSNSPMMEFLMFFNDTTMILLLILLVAISFFFVMMKFMKYFSNNFPESQSLEDMWLFIPIIFLIFMGFPSIKNLYMYEEFIDNDFNFKVMGHQWYWSYEFFNNSFDSILYKDSLNFRLIDTFNHLVMPIKCLIRLLVSSEDVIHSWTIPSLGVKMDAMPGRISQIVLMINRPGMLSGQCSEICGMNHSFMPIIISANSVKNFM